MPGTDPTPSPYTPGGYKSPLKPCRLFVNSIESMPVEKFLSPKIPHRKIWPLKITGKIQFFAHKRLRKGFLSLVLWLGRVGDGTQCRLDGSCWLGWSVLCRQCRFDSGIGYGSAQGWAY